MYMNNKAKKFPIPYEATWDILDGTKMNTYLECPRKFFYEYILGWRPTGANNHLVFGKAWHEALEHLYVYGIESVHIEAAFDKFMQAYRKEIPEANDSMYWPKTPDNAFTALCEYVRKNIKDWSKYKVLYTEIAFCAPISKEHVMYGRKDAIIQDMQTNLIITLEHKTGSRAGRTWDMQWENAMQPYLYTHVDYLLGFPEDLVGTIIMNGTFFMKNKTNPINFQRYRLKHNYNQMQNWLSQVNYWADMIDYDFDMFSNCSISDDIMECFHMNTTNCVKWAGCSYLDYCRAWRNPLQQYERVPFEMKVEHWNPMAEESNAVFNLHDEDERKKLMEDAKEMKPVVEIKDKEVDVNNMMLGI